MKDIKLSKRLMTVANYVIKNKPLADIGSDHAFLPIYLLQKHLIPTAIVGEVVDGPYENAKRKVKEVQLEDKVSVRLGDGLNIINPDEEIGTITICGMGGLLISDILKRGFQSNKIAQDARLVLQPNNAEKELRSILQVNKYKIINEEILEENNKIYEIIVAEKVSDQIQYSEEELTYGPTLLKEKSPTFIKKWKKELHMNESILEQIKKSNNIGKERELMNKIQQIKKVIT